MSRSFPSGKNDSKSFKKPVWLDGSKAHSVSNALKSEIASSVGTYINLQNKWHGKRGQDRRSFLRNTAEYLGETPSSLQRRITRYSFQVQDARESPLSSAVPLSGRPSKRELDSAPSSSPVPSVVPHNPELPNLSKIRRRSSLVRSSKSSRSRSFSSNIGGSRQTCLDQRSTRSDQRSSRSDQQTLLSNQQAPCADAKLSSLDQTPLPNKHVFLPSLSSGRREAPDSGVPCDAVQHVNVSAPAPGTSCFSIAPGNQLLRQPRLQLNHKLLGRSGDGSELSGLARDGETHPISEPLSTPALVSCAVCLQRADITRLNCRFDRWLCDVCLNFIVGIIQDKCDLPPSFKCSNKYACRISVSASCPPCWLAACLLRLHVPGSVHARLLSLLPRQLQRRVTSSLQPGSAQTELSPPAEPCVGEASSPGGRLEKQSVVRVLELGEGWRRRERLTGRRTHVVVLAPDGARFRAAAELQAYLRSCGRSPAEARDYFTRQFPATSSSKSASAATRASASKSVSASVTTRRLTTSTAALPGEESPGKERNGKGKRKSAGRTAREIVRRTVRESVGRTERENGGRTMRESAGRTVRERRGPRVKLVCRSAAVALGKPRATFADRAASVSSQSCVSVSSDGMVDSSDVSEALQSDAQLLSNVSSPVSPLYSTAPIECLGNSSLDRRRYPSLLRSSFVCAAKKVVRKYRQKKRLAVAAAAAAVVRDQLSPGPEAAGGRVRRSRCGSCAGCSARNCQRCLFCQDMTKYGGPGRLRKSCLRRNCLRPLLPGFSLLRQMTVTPESSASRRLPRRVRKQRENAAAGSRLKTPRGAGGSGCVPAGAARSSLVYTAPPVPPAAAPSSTQLLQDSHQEPDEAVDLGVLPAESACVWRLGFAVVSPQPIDSPLLCFICGSSGTDELVFCCGCCEPFHLFCLNYCDVPVTGLQLENWLCRSCQLCSVCGTGVAAAGEHELPEEQLLLVRCRQCGDTFHERCTDSSHRCSTGDKQQLPWTCEKCRKCRACCNAEADHYVGNLPLCSQCYTLHRRGNYCPLCGGDHQISSPGLQKQTDKVLECESCHVWVHASCENLSDDLYHVLCHTAASVSYLCDRCQPQDSGSQGSWRRSVLEQLHEGCAALVRCVWRHLVAAGEKCEDSVKQLFSETVGGTSSQQQVRLVECHERLLAMLGRLQDCPGERYRAALQQYHALMRYRFPWFLPPLSEVTSPALLAVQQPAVRPSPLSARRPPSAAAIEWPRALLDLCSRQYRALRALETGRSVNLSGSPTVLPGSRRPTRRSCCLCLLSSEISPLGRLIWCGATRWLHAGCLLSSAGSVNRQWPVLLTPDGAVSTLGADCAVSRFCSVCGSPGAPLRCRGSSDGAPCKRSAHLLCAAAPDSCWSLMGLAQCGLHADGLHSAEGLGLFLGRRLVVDAAQRRRRAAAVGPVSVDQVSVCIGGLKLHKIGANTVCDGGILVPDHLIVSRVYWSTVNPRRRTVYLVRATLSTECPNLYDTDQFHFTVDHSLPTNKVEQMMASLEEWRNHLKPAVLPISSSPVLDSPPSPETEPFLAARETPVSQEAHPVAEVQSRTPTVEQEVRACVDALVTQVCRSVLEEEESLRLDEFNLPILETMDTDLITLMLNELCETESASHSGLLLSSSSSSPVSSPPLPVASAETVMELCSVYETAEHVDSRTGVQQSGASQKYELGVEKCPAAAVMVGQDRNNNTELQYPACPSYQQQPSRPVPVQPPLRGLVPPPVGPPAGLRGALGDGLHQSAFRPAVRRTPAVVSSSTSCCQSTDPGAKPVAAVMPEPRGALASAWPLRPCPAVVADPPAPQYPLQTELRHWPAPSWPGLSWAPQTEPPAPWPRFWQCDGAADSCSSCSEEEAVDENSPVRCPRCRRLYRTRPSMLRHAAACTLDVDSGDSAASSADEASHRPLFAPRAISCSPTLSSLQIHRASNLPQPVSQFIQPLPNVSQCMPQVLQHVPNITQPVPQVFQAVPSVPQSVPQVLQSVPSLPQPVPQVLQPIPSVPQPVPSVPQSVPQVLQPVPSVPYPVPQVLQAVPSVPQPVPQVLQPVPSVPQHVPQVLQQYPSLPHSVPHVVHPVMNVPHVLRSISNVPHAVPPGRAPSVRVQSAENFPAQARSPVQHQSRPSTFPAHATSSKRRPVVARGTPQLGLRLSHPAEQEVSSTTTPDERVSVGVRPVPASAPCPQGVRQPLTAARRRILPRQTPVVQVPRYSSPTSQVPRYSSPAAVVPRYSSPASVVPAPATLMSLPSPQWVMLPLQQPCAGQFVMVPAATPGAFTLLPHQQQQPVQLYQNQLIPVMPGANIQHIGSFEVPAGSSPCSAASSPCPAASSPYPAASQQVAQSGGVSSPLQSCLVDSSRPLSADLPPPPSPSPSCSQPAPVSAVPSSCIPAASCGPARTPSVAHLPAVAPAGEPKDARKVAKVKPRPTYSYRAAMGSTRSLTSSSTPPRLETTTSAASPLRLLPPDTAPLRVYTSRDSCSAVGQTQAAKQNTPEQTLSEIGDKPDKAASIATPANSTDLDSIQLQKIQHQVEQEEDSSLSAVNTDDSVSAKPTPCADQSSDTIDEKHVVISRDSDEGSARCRGEGKMVYEITSADGYSTSSTDLTSLWRSVFDAVQEARSGQKMRTVQFNGDSLDGRKLLGLTHGAVQALLQQLPGADSCPAHPVKLSDKPTAEISSCARTRGFTGRKRTDVFGWLASPHRSPPVPSDAPSPPRPRAKLGGSKCWRHSSMLELPLAMRYRQLRVTCHSRVGVYRSPIAGRGLFCRRHLDPSEMVIEYVGEMIRASLADVRERKYSNRGLDCYMFRVDDDWVVDATERGNAARFINHSCRPNCYSRVVDILGKKRIVIFALRQICRGEELTYDYKFAIEEDKIPCNCGAKRCRKYLN